MILTDTGFWIALISRGDNHHQRAVEVMSDLDEALVTTWSVTTETFHFLGRHLGVSAQIGFLEILQSGDVELAPPRIFDAAIP